MPAPLDSGFPEQPHYLYAVPSNAKAGAGNVFFMAENGPIAELLRVSFGEEYGTDQVRFVTKAVSGISQMERLRHGEALAGLEVYSEPDRQVYDPPPPVELHRRAQYAVRAEFCADIFKRASSMADDPAGSGTGSKLAGMTPRQLRVSGMNLLLLLAQAYYRLLESAVGSPCHALDLELNQSYLWVVQSIGKLLGNNSELKDFPGKFEPVFADLFPSSIKDSEWEDFVATEADRFLADVQRYVLSHGPIDTPQGSPEWIFVEMYRPSVAQAIEHADAYHKRMQDHLQKLFPRRKPSADNPPRQEPAPPVDGSASRPMAFNSTTFRIMIASPSDVPEERISIRDAIHDWNAQHSEERKVVLLPLAWETHTLPQLGDRPQALVNKQVLKNADALICVFWTRIGTATGVEISGTVEEIREHVKLKKPAILYFSSRAVKPDQVDAEQYAAVKKFKAECKKLGLIDGYDDLPELRRKLDRHLTKLVRDELKVPLVKEESEPRPPSLGETLSAEAKTLLAEAVKDPNATVIHSPTHDGADFETNGKALITGGNPRKRAAFMAALRQLEDWQFLEDQGSGDVYVVTDAGFKAADQMGFKSSH